MLGLWIFALLFLFIGLSEAPVPIIAFGIIGFAYALFGKG